MDTTLAIFAVTYLAIAVGHLPGFAVDRTGAALLGAIALVVAERMTTQQAWDAIDYNTIALLLGLMIVSSSFIVSGFYAYAAARLGALKVRPPTLLAVLIATSAVLSAVLTNDVVVVAMTPLLVAVTLSRRLNPVPFLLGFCFAANTGSAGTIIGSPQNMIIAEGLGLSFSGFAAVAGLPALLSLPLVWATLVLLYRRRWTLDSRQGAAAAPPTPAAPAAHLDHWETLKAGIVAAGVILAFVLSDWPRPLIALGAAGVLLLNRKIASADMLRHVDGDLLVLLFGLFVVNAALATTGLPQHLLADLKASGLDLRQPLWLFAIASLLSNIVGNNPAVMLLVPYLDRGHADAIGPALALGTGFSSNLIVFGSLAGIIVSEAAAKHGVRISFAEFSRAGVPVGLVTMALAVLWIALAV
jgi:Na+/H+ antiporter NhaD/arsenite permease-like protein